MYAIKQFYLKLFNAKTTMKDKTMMCDETKNECCNHADPPWEGPQVIPAQIRRVDNLIFRKINQFARENDVEQATPMHGWIIGYLYRHRDTPVFQRDIEREFSITRSTVTNILQLMERKGYIERRSVPQDARLKQLVLTEEGICFLYKERSLQERQQMIAAVAGVTAIGLRHDPKDTLRLRQQGLIALPEDLGIRRTDATRELLAAKSVADLVEWSGGLYNPPAKFRSW